VAVPVAGPSVTILDSTTPAVVLGSTQPESVVDGRLAAERGWAVARRRSGGGAVLVGRGRCLWVDVVLPRADPRWDDDVSRAAWWLGDVWAGAVEDAGLGGAQTWRGAMTDNRWSRLVCFSGLGPGEVCVGGRKVVGVAQRRTRHGALFQCAALVDGDHRPLLGVLAMAPADRLRAASDLAETTMGLGPGRAADLEAALLRRLTDAYC